MTYKEIQVPSSKIIEVYSKVRNDLEPLLERSKIKVCEDELAEAKFELEEEKVFNELKNALGDFGEPFWGSYLYWDGGSIEEPAHRNLYIRRWGSIFQIGENPIEHHLAICNSALKAAILSETVTLTEDQVETFSWYEKGKPQERVEEWFNTKPEFETQYPEEVVKKVYDFVTKKRKKEEPIKPIPDLIASNPYYNPPSSGVGFWKAFSLTTVLIIIGLLIIM